jgi:hypothetical protein
MIGRPAIVSAEKSPGFGRSHDNATSSGLRKKIRSISRSKRSGSRYRDDGSAIISNASSPRLASTLAKRRLATWCNPIEVMLVVVMVVMVVMADRILSLPSCLLSISASTLTVVRLKYQTSVHDQSTTSAVNRKFHVCRLISPGNHIEGTLATRLELPKTCTSCHLSRRLAA